MTLHIDTDVVEQAPGLAEDLRFDDAEKAGWTVTGPTPTSDGGLRAELTHAFANPEEASALLQSINGSGGPLHSVALSRAVGQDGTTVSLIGSPISTSAVASVEIVGVTGRTSKHSVGLLSKASGTPAATKRSTTSLATASSTIFLSAISSLSAAVSGIVAKVAIPLVRWGRIW